MSKILSFDHVDFSYGDNIIFKSFDFSLSTGEHVSLCGDSGKGKTTLLRLCAGLESPASGLIENHASKTAVCFQEPRLLPWLSVLENTVSVLNGPDSLACAEHYLDLCGLSDAADKMPSELSGGMQKRAALARCLAYGGDLYLFDEPLSSLDTESADELLSVIMRDTEGAAVILVTHDMRHASAFSERIVKI